LTSFTNLVPRAFSLRRIFRKGPGNEVEVLHIKLCLPIQITPKIWCFFAYVCSTIISVFRYLRYRKE
jgi:hypothetical protein